MPTENRSSNTEMVSVPRKPTPAMLEAMRAPCGETDDGYPNPATLEERYMAAINAAPAEQHQGEPVAHALAEKVREALDRQACPNAWMVIAYEAVVQNYTHADPGEVERLIAECWAACGGNGPATRETLLSALKLMNEAEDEQSAEVERLRGVVNEWETKWQQETAQVGLLHAQLAERDALLRDLDDAWNSHDGKERFYKLMAKIEALSPSAKPSAPVERDERAAFELIIGQKWPGIRMLRINRPGAPADGEYELPGLEGAWQGWQARAALDRKPS